MNKKEYLKKQNCSPRNKDKPIIGFTIYEDPFPDLNDNTDMLFLLLYNYKKIK